MELQRPKVGVGIIVRRADGRVLFVQRRGAHGEGTWSVPGGHLEFGETVEQCGMREAAEETGVLVKNVRPLTCTNDVFSEEGKHYVTVWVVGEWAGGDARVCDEKQARVEWMSPELLPHPLFLPLMNLIRQGIDLRTL